MVTALCAGRQVPTARGLAVSIAQMIRDAEGLDDVRIVQSQGFLSTTTIRSTKR